jgi:hypothetical protein
MHPAQPANNKRLWFTSGLLPYTASRATPAGNCASFGSLPPRAGLRSTASSSSAPLPESAFAAAGLPAIGSSTPAQALAPLASLCATSPTPGQTYFVPVLSWFITD